MRLLYSALLSTTILIAGTNLSSAGSFGDDSEFIRKEAIVNVEYKKLIINDKEWAETTSEIIEPKTHVMRNSIYVKPSMSLTGTYIDNIYSKENNKDNDFFSTIEPKLNIGFKHDIIAADLDVSANFNKYNDHKSEDNNNFRSSINVDISPSSNVIIPFGFSYEDAHVSRSENFTNNIISATPNRFQKLAGNIGLNINKNNIELLNSIAYQNDSYENNILSNNGSIQILDDNDKDILSYKGLLAYNFNDEKQVYLLVEADNSNYKNSNYINNSYSGINRDNNKVSGFIGIKTDFNDFINNSIAIGYSKRSYDDNNLEDAKDLVIRALVNLKYKDNTRFKLSYNRESKENYDYVYSYIEDDIIVNMDHSITNNLSLTTEAALKLRNFKSIDRDDEKYSAGLGLKYDFNPNFYISGQYMYDNRNSNITGFDYDTNIIMLRIEAKTN